MKENKNTKENKRLIDANALINLFESYGFYRGERLCGDMLIADIIDFIEDFPTAEDSRWISVSEKLPNVPIDDEQYQPVLVTYLSYYDKSSPLCDDLAVWTGTKWIWWNNTDEDVIVHITHWMPLPEPAK